MHDSLNIPIPIKPLKNLPLQPFCMKLGLFWMKKYQRYRKWAMIICNKEEKKDGQRERKGG